ncbi:MAG: glycine betaine ABC transporter substrate-binding protein [Methylocystis sp.]
MAVIIFGSCSNAHPAERISVGSKKFTESVILADLAAELAAAAGASVLHRRELGGTRLLFDALMSREIDVYPEYVRTLTNEILVNEDVSDEEALERALAKRNLRMSRPLGFSDAYGLGMKSETAQRMGIQIISDLAHHPSLRFGISDEFLRRKDGWPAIRAAYGLTAAQSRGMDHDIAYKALVNESVDVIDLYSTDAEIGYYGLLLLIDDLHKFPDNEAILLYRAELEREAPRALRAALQLEGKIDRQSMIAMNAAAKIDRRPDTEVAARFLAARLGVAAVVRDEGLGSRVWRRTCEHLWLSFASLGAAILVAVPLGVLTAKRPIFGHAILATASVMQTIPSLALLVFMIPFLGIGPKPAIVALFLYSLLPIIRNTASGLTGIPSSIRNSAIALGLTPIRRLRLIELPLAAPAILAGIKTAAVINIGTATLGALIGAGGYGEPIFAGVRLDDFGLIMEGAVPAAVLALIVQGLFELAERFMIPHGLRLKGRMAP